ncbi:hypothetical protein D9758_008032 [Tetrapyrgos nigripes]|uniref:Uncharacterized protein n=1 Tax=Tetrapyrgos nigripes TaxID=182062 RepID=A0A8H5FWI5_9AGAR|nr:hypothetical protein D9758_008032 [Tetrapyrgos nigripes]
MPFDFPPELISLVIGFLDDRATVLASSLVARTWLPGARYHLLSDCDYVLELETLQITSFLPLLESPYSSFHLLHVTELHINQKRPKPIRDIVIGRSTGREWHQESVFNDLLCWRSLDGKSLAEIFPSITSLYIQWVNFSTLSQSALESLRSDYEGITTLKLDNVDIHSPIRLKNFIFSFSSLKTLILLSELSNPFENVEDSPESHLQCPDIGAVHVLGATSAMLDFVTTLKYPHGVTVLSICFEEVSISDDCVDANRKLLQTLGTSLQQLTLRAAMVSTDSRGSTQSAAVHDLLRFNMNPNLQHIFIDLSDDSLLIPFLQNLESDTTKLHSLKLGLAQPSLRLDANDPPAGPKTDWPLLDQVLSDAKQFPNLTRLAFYPRGADHAATRIWEITETQILSSRARSTLETGMQRVLTRVGSGYATVPNGPLPREAVLEALEQKRILHDAEWAQKKSLMMDKIRSLLPRIEGKVEIVLGEASTYD